LSYVVSYAYERSYTPHSNTYTHLQLTSLVVAPARKNFGVAKAKTVIFSDAARFISAVSDGLERESEIIDLTSNVCGVKTGAICKFASTGSENNFGSHVLFQSVSLYVLLASSVEEDFGYDPIGIKLLCYTTMDVCGEQIKQTVGSTSYFILYLEFWR
jgi:hypothetical protein